MKTSLRSLILLLAVAQMFWSVRSDASIEGPANYKNYVVSSPEPAWWSLARRGMRGKVVCQVKIDPKNGDVTEVHVLKKTMFPAFNAEVVLTCFKWKFKPGTITEATIPFELEVRGFGRQVR
ncbi:MAG: energy transducer TonB [Spartobacteria bacterium]